MRSQAEIVNYMRELVAGDKRMDHEYTILLPCLDFTHARPFLKPEATAEGWESAELTLTEDDVEHDARNCLQGAWDTIDRHDRVLASRLIGNLRAYVWLLGTDEQVEEFEAVPRRPFGGPVFRWVAETFGWPEATRLPTVRMGLGFPCSDLCIRGCKPRIGLVPEAPTAQA